MVKSKRSKKERVEELPARSWQPGLVLVMRERERERERERGSVELE